MNFDRPYFCQCGARMQVLMPIWITPGESSVDTEKLDFESDSYKDSSNWWCEDCQEHEFPVDYDCLYDACALSEAAGLELGEVTRILGRWNNAKRGFGSAASEALFRRHPLPSPSGPPDAGDSDFADCDDPYFQKLASWLAVCNTEGFPEDES